MAWGSRLARMSEREGRPEEPGPCGGTVPGVKDPYDTDRGDWRTGSIRREQKPLCGLDGLAGIRKTAGYVASGECFALFAG